MKSKMAKIQTTRDSSEKQYINPDEILDNQDVERLDRLETFKNAIIQVAHHYRVDISEQNIRLSSLWNRDLSDNEMIRFLAKQCGMAVKIESVHDVEINSWIVPIVVELNNGRVAIVHSISDGKEVALSYIEDKGIISILPLSELKAQIKNIFLLRPLQNVADPRVDDYIKPVEKHWVWKTVFKDLTPYKHVMLGSFIVNLLGLAGITYSMQTYDRIIPAKSYPTMWVLFAGVMIALILDFILRLLRYGVIDILGKRADLRISDRVFGHALRIKNTDRPRSTGTFISQIRELEQIREMITSSTVVAMCDLPFFFMFLFIIYLVGGILWVVPLVGMILMVLPGLLSQKKLAGLAQMAMRESSLRNAMLVESIQGLDDIKLLQSEYRFQQQWLHYTSTTASSNLELKHFTHRLTTWSYSIQSAVFVFVVLAGTPLAMDGELTTGAMVACSILSSRMMAPISQIASLLTRWQQTKVAINGLDSIMELPTDNSQGKTVHKSHIDGKFEYNRASFKHNSLDERISLFVAELKIQPGEKVAILGRNGSGKSTLLSSMSGLLFPTDGVVTIDNISLDHIDTADLRRDIGYLPQDSKLFYGSIRDNLILGAPLASDEQIFEALQKTSAVDFVNKIPVGLDYVISEGGVGLSGGQKQSLLLARLILRNPSVVLLDEPTASLDEIAEVRFIEEMKKWVANKTLIISTHRKRVLELVDRVIVLSDGRVVLDKPKHEAMELLQ